MRSSAPHTAWAASIATCRMGSVATPVEVIPAGLRICTSVRTGRSSTTSTWAVISQGGDVIRTRFKSITSTIARDMSIRPR